jgi:acylphosphatase
MVDHASEDGAMHRKTCIFSGRVQGVGFRYTAQNIAQRHDVRGYVKNLPDGRVELTMEGPDEEMDIVVDSIRERMDSFIGKIDFNQLPATGEFQRFVIQH